MISRSLATTLFAVVLAVTSLLAGSGRPGGVEFAPTALSDITRLVGEQICFTLTARDENGNVIRSWNEIGTPTTITLINSTANTDSSTQSWNDDPDGYTWAVISFNNVELTKISDNEWSIPNTVFVDGVATICLIHTKAEADVYLEITPDAPFLNQVSPTMEFLADDITNYFVDITSAISNENTVYMMRPYEVVIAPRDRYLNISNQEIKTKFSARWPGEFSANTPGLADIFAGEVFIRGLTNYLIASRVEREKPIEPQYIMAFASENPSIRGFTNPYEVRSHAPYPFDLLEPKNNVRMILHTPFHPSLFCDPFIWERPSPPDPYWDIQVSRFSPTTVSDSVHYTWHMMDEGSRARVVHVLSDDVGKQARLTLREQQMFDLTMQLTGQWGGGWVLWYVTATDYLYTTTSSPSPGHRLQVVVYSPLSVNPQTVVPSGITLSQNYPNPFNPSTTIDFTTTQHGTVTLRVYNILGEEVATIVNEALPPGSHSVSFNAEKLQSGVYHYVLEAEGQRLSKNMVVTK